MVDTLPMVQPIPALSRDRVSGRRLKRGLGAPSVGPRVLRLPRRQRPRLIAGPGMRPPVHLVQPLHRDTRVELRAGQQGVPEQRLQVSDVGPAVVHQGRHAVPHRRPQTTESRYWHLGPQHAPRFGPTSYARLTRPAAPQQLLRPRLRPPRQLEPLQPRRPARASAAVKALTD